MTGPDGDEGRMRLHPSVVLEGWVDDRSVFGSPLTSRPDDLTRELFAEVVSYGVEHGPAELLRAGPDLLAATVASDAFATIADRDDRGGWVLADQVLYPDPSFVRFAGLRIRSDVGRDVEVRVPAPDWEGLHEMLAALAGPGIAAGDRHRLAPHEAALLDGLVDEGIVVTPAPGPDADGGLGPLDQPGLTFLGHNGVVVRSATTRLVVDPFFCPAVSFGESGYRPLSVAEVGPFDAVALTHSHPDHFVPGTLLQIPVGTPVFVPHIERETVLSVAMRDRLRELGFSQVTELDWGDHTVVGDIEVHALPFYGEQPTDGPVLHPEIRNAGNTFVVRTPSFSAALLADSGRDHLGDVKQVAVETRSRLGAVDVVFSGYRAWTTYPVQMLSSSVARYLLFVPPLLWSARLSLMNGIDDAIDVAERWGARHLVPYADGGAPWFWERGLGPRLDDQARELDGFDPFPERVVDAAGRRTHPPEGGDLTSPVAVTLLRPNDTMLGFGDGRGPHVERIPGNSWPYAERVGT